MELRYTVDAFLPETPDRPNPKRPPSAVQKFRHSFKEACENMGQRMPGAARYFKRCQPRRIELFHAVGDFVILHADQFNLTMGNPSRVCEGRFYHFSIQAMADELGLKYHEVRRALADLAKCKIISRVRRWHREGPDRFKGRNSVTKVNPRLLDLLGIRGAVDDCRARYKRWAAKRRRKVMLEQQTAQEVALADQSLAARQALEKEGRLEPGGSVRRAVIAGIRSILHDTS